MALKKELAANVEQQVQFLRQMVLIRRFEERSAEMYQRGRIGGFLHLYVGEEAIAVGLMNALGPQDKIVSHYREHGHALARGMDPKIVMAELFGRTTGSSKGKGGSMHLFDAKLGFLGGHAIVGAQLPIACGLAFAAQFRGEDSVAVAIFGDGAVNEGEFHEALNLAAVWDLPVLFLLENNGFGMGTRASRVTAQSEIYVLAERYNMPARRIDGMNVGTVYEQTREAVDYIRRGGGPYFLEALTYRFRGHSMADPMDYRKREEEYRWEARDPILTLQERLLAQDAISQSDLDTLNQGVEHELEEAIQFAEESPIPPPEALFEDIYA